MTVGLAAAPASEGAFSRVELPDVTLAAVTSVALPATLHALRHSAQQCRFASILLLTDLDPPQETAVADTNPPIEWRRIPHIASRDDYSRFMLNDLYAHVVTSHVLLVQWDGYVLRPQMWLPEFIDCDYIGAPWPHFADGLIVGNGGFSLRSARLLRAVAGLRLTSGEAEDIAICRTHRSRLEAEYAIRFAPPELARRFAFERCPEQGNEFGFHGVFNVPGIVGARAFRALLRELEPSLIAPSELRELLRYALRNLDPALAMLVLRRMAGIGGRFVERGA